MLTARTLGETIRRQRLAAGLTQRQLAAASGVGQRFIVELENGKESCRLGLAFRVAYAIGLAIKIEVTTGTAASRASRTPKRRP